MKPFLKRLCCHHKWIGETLNTRVCEKCGQPQVKEIIRYWFSEAWFRWQYATLELYDIMRSNDLTFADEHPTLPAGHRLHEYGQIGAVGRKQILNGQFYITLDKNCDVVKDVEKSRFEILIYE